MSPSIKQACEQQLKQLFIHAQKILWSQHSVMSIVGYNEKDLLHRLGLKPSHRSRLKEPSLLFTQRGKIAGSALLQRNIIKLHPTLLADNLDYYLDEVIAHELSHILVYQLFGSQRGILRRTRVKPHGTEWQTIMSGVFNLSPKVTHQLDVKKVGLKHFDYCCGCQTVAFSLIRHNKILRQKQAYYCKRCSRAFVEVPVDVDSKVPRT